MPTTEKAAVIEQAKEWYSNSAGVVFADYRGLSTKELQKLRGSLKAKGGDIHVIKNTLFRIAAGDDVQKFPYELHNGPTAVAFIYENESECSKVLLDFATSSKKLAVKGGFFGGKAFTAKEVEALSKLPHRDVLIAQVIGVIAAPLSNLVSVIEALYADPIRVIGAVADKVAESSPAPVKKEEAKVEAAAPAPEAEVVAEPAADAPEESSPAEDAPEAPAAE
ncbi:MAG: 50S ribosomal protein L10 [Armatimonadetes bacterium]|nr:50S ribosomal protein L10 [Armatimonadota bacterium]